MKMPARNAIYVLAFPLVFLSPNFHPAIQLSFAAAVVFLSCFESHRRSDILRIIVFLVVCLAMQLFVLSDWIYTIRFILLVLGSAVFVSLVNRSQQGSALLRASSIFLLLSIFVDHNSLANELYYSRESIHKSSYVLLRQRGFFPEPAGLGYWSSVLAYISLSRRMFFTGFLYIFCVLLSFSVGAFVLFSISLFFLPNIDKRAWFCIFLVLVTLGYYFFYDQFYIKITSSSAFNRLDNLMLVFEQYVKEPWLPRGLGPIEVDGKEIGSLNFLVWVLYGFGALVFPFLLIIKLGIINRAAYAVMFVALSFMVGAYWEYPLIFLALSAFYISNHPLKDFRTRIENGCG